MNGFLAQVAADLWGRYGQGVSGLTMVFPSRRARLFFGEALSEIVDRPLWQPADMSIDTIAEELSGLALGERLQLVVELFRIYREFHPEETFDEFYFWGELLLGDFDSIDKYLIDADVLFSNLVDNHALDYRFDYLEPDQRAAIEKFWGSFSGRHGGETVSGGNGDGRGNEEADFSPEQRDFLRVWRTLAPIYHRFRARLRELGVGYQGMIYRAAAERIQADKAPQIPDRQYVIAGFNALSKCERVMFEWLKKNFHTDFYWDWDRYFVDDPGQEAGRFMRDNLRRFPAAESLPDGHSGTISGGHDNFLKPKHIRSVSTASDVLQCKAAGVRLSELAAENSGKLDKNTAIVLCDESLLVPLLWSLPEEVANINVTMGYPLRMHPSYTFLEHRLVEFSKRHKDWRQISERLLEAIAEKTATPENGPQIADSEPDNGKNAEFFTIIAEHISTLGRLLENSPDIDISSKIYATLLRRSLQSATIPFEGEPLEGVQVMGILETRALDFENIIFLSSSDASMPGSLAGAPSFIPYNLKMAYGLPTPEHHEGVWAYHFFRLFGRARNVDLVWSHTSDDRSATGPSRYILQLDYESPHRIEYQSVNVDVNLSPAAPVVVEKSVEKIPRTLSPSAFWAFVECPLKFYFQAVARLRTAEDEDDGEIDNALFGSLLHLAMQKLYAPLVDEHGVREKIRALVGSELVRRAVSEAVEELCGRDGHDDTSENASESGGNILLVSNILTDYLNHRILPFDASRSDDFTIEKLEEWVEAEFELERGGGSSFGQERQHVVFRGKVDRSDRLKDNTLRVVDYKTGRPEGRGVLSAIFQVRLYALMLEKSDNSPDNQQVTPALYYIRDLERDVFSASKEPFVVADGEGGFERFFHEQLARLFDPAEPFAQCNDLKVCALCDFAVICGR